MRVKRSDFDVFWWPNAIDYFTALEVSRHQGIELANLFTRIGSDPAAFRAGQVRFESGKRVEWRLR